MHVSPEMIEAGIATLKKYISVDYEPIYPYEEIMEEIFTAMRHAKMTRTDHGPPGERTRTHESPR